MSNDTEALKVIQSFYDAGCALDVELSATYLHPDYRSLTSEPEKSKESFIEFYQELAPSLASITRQVKLCVSNDQWTGLMQDFHYRFKDGTEELLSSVDFYRLQDGFLIEHQGVTAPKS